MKKNNFREKLAEFLTEDELSRLKTAFDVVGDIAILEIDEEFKHKEKQIANALLDYHKNINTVLKKAGEHTGKYRRQKMQFVAGEDKKIALHKENNSFIYVDVEKSYFSPRLSTERKRIMQQINDGENILIMFSGVGPYPSVIARNKHPRRIVGVEMNPAAHKMALLNLKKNKLKNVEFFKGDVNQIIPELTKKPIIGLKSNWRQNHLKKKLPHKPQILEIYIGRGDLENYPKEFEISIANLAKKGYSLVLHAPMVYREHELTIASEIPKLNKNAKECFDFLEKLCSKYNLKGFIGHPYTLPKNERSYQGKTYRHTLKNMYHFLQMNRYKYLFLENLMFGPFANPDTLVRASNKLSIKLCVDLAHLYLYCQTYEKFYESFKKFPEDAYYHIADSKHLGAGVVDYHEHSYPVGEGNINFNKILPLINEGIAEVVNKDELNPVEMIDSWKKLNKISHEIIKFDRVLMPLPKSAEDFLPLALSAVKKGGIVHFYDFLHEDHFYQAEEKAKKACENAGFRYKKLDFVKCGQHSPRTFRVCLDFKVQ